MIAELVAIGATIQEAFVNSLQVNKDVLESILLSLHMELRTKGGESESEYLPY